MSEKKDLGWYVRPESPSEIMDCIGGHVAECYGKFGDEAQERAQRIAVMNNERELLADVTHAAQMVAEYGAKQLHMKHLREAVLALQKHRTAVQSLQQMREKH